MTRKTLKKLIAALMTALVMFSICGCAVKMEPGKQVEANLEQIKSEKTSADLVSELSKDENITAKYADEFEQLVTKMQDFDYVIKEEKVDEEAGTAIVTVTITTYDLRSAYEAAYDQVLIDAAEGKIDEETDLDSYVYDTLFEYLFKLDTKDRVVDVDINCVKNEAGDWETDIETNEAFHDAWSGGLNSGISELRE